MFDDKVAFELVKQIERLRGNMDIEESKDLIDILDDKINDLVTYCKKYNKNINGVIGDYERNRGCLCGV
jgi:hypothetical protein